MNKNLKVSDLLENEGGFWKSVEEDLPYGFVTNVLQHIAVALTLKLTYKEMLEIDSDDYVFVFTYNNKNYKVSDRDELENRYEFSRANKVLALIPEHLHNYFNVDAYLEDLCKSDFEEYLSWIGAIEVSVDGEELYVIEQ